MFSKKGFENLTIAAALSIMAAMVVIPHVSLIQHREMVNFGGEREVAFVYREQAVVTVGTGSHESRTIRDDDGALMTSIMNSVCSGRYGCAIWSSTRPATGEETRLWNSLFDA